MKKFYKRLIEYRKRTLNNIRIAELSKILQHINLSPSINVLDAGCGNGIQSLYLSLKQENVFVVSGDLVSKYYVKGKSSLLNFIVFDIHYLPFRNTIFNIIVLSHVVEHLRDKDKAIREIKRVSTRDTILLIILPTVLWKILQIMTHYLFFIYISGFKIKYPIDLFIPSIHGSFKSNREELQWYNLENIYLWLKEKGFNIRKKIRLKFVFPYILLTSSIAERLGFYTSVGLILELNKKILNKTLEQG